MAQAIRSYRPAGSIVRIELKIEPVDQIRWLSAQKSSVKIFGANQDDSAAIAGVGEALGLQGQGKPAYAKIFQQLRRHLTPQYPYLQWYGGFCFDHLRRDREWHSFGTWRFVLPRFELARDGRKMIFSCNLLGPVDKKRLLKDLAGLTIPKFDKNFQSPLHSRRDSPAQVVWQESVDDVLRKIRQGQCSKVVLARRTDFLFRQPLNPWAMLKTLKKVTPDSYHFAFQFGPAVFLGASPERVYQRRGTHVRTQALAGTKPPSFSAQALLKSAKDRHEHQIVVEAIAAALRPLCHGLNIASGPQVVTLSNGHHLNTEFEGHLKDGVSDEDVLQSLHPTPAVGGAPRDLALPMIRRLEPFGRGWYAGPLGYVGLDWVEFVVGIRSGLVQGKKLSVFAGAGIVAGSNATDEWLEVENKIGNFIKIIGKQRG